MSVSSSVSSQKEAPLKGRTRSDSLSGAPASPSMGQVAKEMRERKRKKQLMYLANQGGRSRQPAGQGQTHSSPHVHRDLGCRGTAAHTDGL